MQENSANIIVSLSKGEYLETKKRRLVIQPNYYRVGNGTMNKHNIKSVDLLNEVMNMTKAEQLVISTIKDLIPWNSQTGEVHAPLSTLLSKTNSVVFHKGFKLLKEKNLVRRTKKSHYMINPSALVPLDFSIAQKLWEKSEDN